jgi:hypothetical protein
MDAKRSAKPKVSRGKKVGTALLLLLTFFALLLPLSSREFSSCTQQGRHPAVSGTMEEIARKLPRARLYLLCFTRGANATGDALTGLFAAVLAVSSLLLWRSSKDQIRLNDERTRLLERAYVSAAPLGVAPFHLNKLTDAHVVFQNVGKLPATNVRWFIDAEIGSDEQRTDFPIGALVGKHVLPPGGAMRQNRRTILTDDAVMQLIESALVLYVWGRIEYWDGFDDRHTIFCHRYSRPALAPLVAAGERYNGNGQLIREGARYHQYGNDAT